MKFKLLTVLFLSATCTACIMGLAQSGLTGRGNGMPLLAGVLALGLLQVTLACRAFLGRKEPRRLEDPGTTCARVLARIFSAVLFLLGLHGGALSLLGRPAASGAYLLAASAAFGFGLIGSYILDCLRCRGGEDDRPGRRLRANGLRRPLTSRSVTPPAPN
ncbi:MAG: hypothetical protein D6702_10575 [Planctomycetota bacterium]|nr:MAG: hypothetical protein D6702_10575 [Planctomycetota bacterium]